MSIDEDEVFQATKRALERIAADQQPLPMTGTAPAPAGATPPLAGGTMEITIRHTAGGDPGLLGWATQCPPCCPKPLSALGLLPMDHRFEDETEQQIQHLAEAWGTSRDHVLSECQRKAAASLVASHIKDAHSKLAPEDTP